MAFHLPTITPADALAILEEIHIELIKQTLRTYLELKLPYPPITLSSLAPPHGKISSEHPYFPCHINVLFWETYKLRKHDKHFPIKHRLSLEMAREIGGAQSSRFIGAHGFPTLYKVIASGAEDGATIISLDSKHHHPKLTHHQAHINADASRALKHLIQQLSRQGIKIRLSDGTKEYHRLRNKLADKLYEFIAWPNTGGQKHLAATCLQLNMEAPGLVIDILSKSGAYTRVRLDEQNNPIVRHIVIQPKEALERKGVSVPPEYLFDGHYLLLALTYRRTDTHELDQPWMRITSQTLVHPGDPKKMQLVSVL